MKYNILHGLLLIFGIFAGLNAAAQTRVSGTVKDSKGEPVIGAVVMLQGSSSIGSTTDLDGKYTLTIPASVKKPVLVASCISYVTQDIETGGRTVIDIVLQEDAEELEEVVVVGYGSMRKSDLTGSVSSVKIDESKAARSATIDQLLQGHAAGVQVLNNSASPDGGVSIRIRGLSSFNGSSEPLYVVDGIIINGDSSSASLLSAGADNSDSGEEINGLMGLNPQDIASMEILKDASATAIYGALGANGVVLITTKSATKDRPSVRFNAGVDYRTPAKKADILSFDEFCNFIGDKFDRNIGSNIKTYAGNIFNDPSGRTGIKVFGIDWQDKIMRNAFGQRYHLSISGRPKSFSYAFSLGYSDNQGIVKSTGVKQYTIRLNLDKTLSNRLKIGTRTNVAFVNSTMTQSTGGGRMTSATSAIRSMLSFRPYTTVDTEADNYDEEDDDLRSSPELWINPHHFSNSRKEYRITPSVYATYTIVKGLTFDSKLGGDYRNTEQQKFKSSRINTTTEGSNGATSTVERFTWNWDNMLTYKKKIKGHNINATIGSSSRDNLSTSQTVQGWNIEQYRSGIGSINAAPNSSLSYTESESQTLSFFARGVYSYRDRYVLTATYRADGSSKFQGSNKWAFFPSFAFAWRLSQEPWFKVPKVSSAKLRLGWGRVGNQSISNYQTMSTYGNARLPDHAKDNPAESLVAVYPNNLSNPDLKW
ncbi:MAG: SusC/RagA family TonB-linked outer membrane protein, partial [Bacteroidales bacterium]|nr:SusC/RagA family TonB-linked outer membrane protein [Bacteroidales bacterium]